MKAAVLSKFAFLPSVAGIGLTMKIVAAVFVMATAAGGALYAFSQKSYAPETIRFDGRDFYLLIETKFPDFPDALEGAEKYAAVYTSATEAEREADAEWNLNHARLDYQVLYAANPAPEWMRDGAFSPAAYYAAIKKQTDWHPDPSVILHETREEGGEYFTATVIDTPQPESARLLALISRSGAPRKNAFANITYFDRFGLGKFDTPEEWTNAESAAYINRVYDLLAEYPLTHNEELLAELAEAVE